MRLKCSLLGLCRLFRTTYYDINGCIHIWGLGGDGLRQKSTHAYKVGGLVKNVMILGVRTFWVPPKSSFLTIADAFTFIYAN